MPAAGYRTCRKPGCGYAIKHGKRRCLRCGTPVAEREFNSTAPARPAPKTRDLGGLQLWKGWR